MSLRTQYKRIKTLSKDCDKIMPDIMHENDREYANQHPEPNPVKKFGWHFRCEFSVLEIVTVVLLILNLIVWLM